MGEGVWGWGCVGGLGSPEVQMTLGLQWHSSGAPVALDRACSSVPEPPRTSNALCKRSSLIRAQFFLMTGQSRSTSTAFNPSAVQSEMGHP